MILSRHTFILTHRRSRVSSLASRLESLETRTLLSGITSYQLGDLFQPNQETIDNSGNLWIADELQIDKVTKAANGTVSDTIFLTNQFATSIVFDPANGHLFVADQTSTLVEYDLAGNIVNQYTTDAANAPSLLTVANDGAIWFSTAGTFGTDADTTFNSNIGRLDLSGTITLQTLPSNTQISDLSPAADGSIWFSTQGTDNPITSGPSFLGHAAFSAGAINVTTYTIPQTAALIDSVVVAPDNSLWFTVGGDGNSASHRPPITEQIGHATVSGSSLNVTTYNLPKNSGEGVTDPRNLAIDSTGLVWFDDANAIDNINPITGDITRTSPNDPGSAPNDLVISGNNIWITYAGGNNNLVNIDTTTFTPDIAGTDPDIAASAGQPFSGPVAVFTSPDAGPFTYTIDFGNGSTQSGTVPFDSSHVYTLSGTTTYANPGSYNTTVTITSANGDVASFNGHAVVTNSGSIPLIAAGINLQVERGLALTPNVSGVANVVVAQFSGPLATYSATINWGDSTSSTGQIVSQGNNQYYVELPAGTSKSYSAIGTYNVSVVITDGTHSVTATSTATVSAVPIVASQNLILQPLLGGIVLANVATFTADNGSNANWFHATINWGDGTHSTGLVVKTSSGHYLILGLHIYARKGTYSVTTTILDTPDSETAIATASVKIK